MSKNKFRLVWALCLINVIIAILVSACESLYMQTANPASITAHIAYPIILVLSGAFATLLRKQTDVPVEETLSIAVILCTVLTCAAGLISAFIATPESTVGATAALLTSRGLALTIANGIITIAVHAYNDNSRKEGGRLL